MTCIVGIKHKNKVYIGADSCLSNPWTWNLDGGHKLFRNGPFLVGVCGSCRLVDLLTYSLSLPNKKIKKKNTVKYMKTEFVENMRTMLNERGHNRKKDSVESLDGSDFLIGFNNKLFKVQGDLSVVKCPYYATGSGKEVALGSLYTTRKNKNPKKRILTALKAAEAVVPSVRGPFKIKKL